MAFAVGCSGDDDDPDTSPTPPPSTQAPTADAPKPTTEAPTQDAAAESDEATDETADEGPRLSPEERAAVRTVRDYVDALDQRDGEAVCALLVSGALEGVELPRERGGCAASLSASIGYRDPRGLPVWEGARAAEIVSIELGSEDAKVVATTVTSFSDRDELSIEDDVVYLQRVGERWLVAKPSSTLHRAVGIADVPPSVLAPPG